MLALDDEQRIEDSHLTVEIEGEGINGVKVGAREFEPVRRHRLPRIGAIVTTHRHHI